MDAAGAQELHRRLSAQAHWQQAQAVQNGSQPPADPDAGELEEIRDGIRFYGCSHGVRTVKCLVDGRWEWRELPEEERLGA